MKKNKKLLAYVHIEKAAGTTFTNILENNYTFKHCYVWSLKKRFPVVFDAEDMMVLQRINPFIRAISGHHVRPFSDLSSVRDVNYITVLREPVARYLSHYQYWVEKMNNPIGFEDFLKDEKNKNFQTKKIAGNDDVERAKSYLDSFFLVGVVEDFHSFLKVLQRKMAPKVFSINYEKKMNVGSKKIVNQILSNLNQYKDYIEENNLLDKELYLYAQNIFDREKQDCSPFIDTFENVSIRKRYLWKIFRSFYMVPMFKLYAKLYTSK